MSTTSVVVASINGAWALIAAVAHCRAMRQRGDRAMHAAVAVMALVYAIGFAWLLAHQTQRVLWSEVMSGVGLVSWPLVWVWPAIGARRAERKLAAVAVKLKAAADE